MVRDRLATIHRDDTYDDVGTADIDPHDPARRMGLPDTDGLSRRLANHLDSRSRVVD